MVGIGNQRKKARTTAALESIRSVMPYSVDCFVRGGTTIKPTVGNTGGSDVCNPASGITWPALPKGCVYAGAGTFGSGGDVQVAIVIKMEPEAEFGAT